MPKESTPISPLRRGFFLFKILLKYVRGLSPVIYESSDNLVSYIRRGTEPLSVVNGVRTNLNVYQY